MATQAANGRGRLLNPFRIIGWGGAAALLLAPLVAMQFTNEVDWTVSDFIFAGVLFLSVGLAFEFLARAGAPAYRAGSALALLAACGLIWATGAVGIIGSEDNDANLMFAGVLVVAILGAVIGRFRPIGMARAMAAAAVVQALIGVVALAGRMGAGDPSWPLDVVGATGLWTAMWLASAWLFRKAGAAPAAEAHAGR